MTELRRTPLGRPAGRLSSAEGGLVSVTGLSGRASVGDRVLIGLDGGKTGWGEVIGLTEDAARILPELPLDGMSPGQRAICDGPMRLAPDDSWIGRIIDPNGKPLDGRPLLNGRELKPLMRDPPNPADRRSMGARIDTGLSVFNTFLPLVRGQRIGLFAGSGVGKSTLLSRLAIGIEADVVVFALIGERGRELREFTDRVLGPQGMRRSVVVAATADRSPLLRRRAAYTAMTVAEHFRDAGKHVVLLADSITRFAEAHREIALAGGETAAMRGYPPSTAARITGLAERAGPGSPDSSDITAVFTVLVPASDMDEPVADTLRGVLDGHAVLDRAIAERGRFPPVDVARSVSRALREAASADEQALLADARGIIADYERSEMMVQAGLYAPGSDPRVDRALKVWPRLDGFFATRATGGIEGSYAALAECLAAEGPPEDGAPDAI